LESAQNEIQSLRNKVFVLEKFLKEKEIKQREETESDEDGEKITNDLEEIEFGTKAQSYPHYKWDIVSNMNGQEKLKQKEKIKQLEEEEEVHGDSSTLQVYIMDEYSNQKERDTSSDFVKNKDRPVKNPSQSILSLKDAKNLFGQNVRVVTVPDSSYYPSCHSPDISDTESESDIKDEDLDNPKCIEKDHNNSEQNEIHLKQLLDNEKNKKILN